jgi:invasion protein IalB
MSRIRIVVFAAFGLALAGIAAALAQAPKPAKVGAFGDWEVFTYRQESGKICYMIARPETSLPEAARRGDVYITVTHRPADQVRNEVGVTFGYPLADNAIVEAAIDGRSFILFAHETSAWARDAKTDQALTEAMTKGDRLTVKGLSRRGTATTDRYSLKGFTAARKAIDRACPS